MKNLFRRKRPTAHPKSATKTTPLFVWHNLDTNRTTTDNLVVRRWINEGHRLHCEVLEVTV